MKRITLTFRQLARVCDARWFDNDGYRCFDNMDGDGCDERCSMKNCPIWKRHSKKGSAR